MRPWSGGIATTSRIVTDLETLMGPHAHHQCLLVLLDGTAVLRSTRSPEAERLRGAFLRGGFHPNMQGPHLSELAADDAVSQFRTVAVAAQVAQVELPQFGGDHLGCDGGGRVVG